MTYTLRGKIGYEMVSLPVNLTDDIQAEGGKWP
jgi:hypothetical protein